MSKILTDNQYYHQIANVIREQNGTSNTYTPPQMVSALKDLFYEEVEGVPPITFQGIGENLLDYRIDGASGGVGDRTSNLFSSEIINNYHLNPTTGLPVAQGYRCATVEPIQINYNNLILQYKSTNSNTLFMYSLFTNNTLIRRVAGNNSKTVIDTTGADKIYISFYATSGSVTAENLSEVMLSETEIDYEPYGYKIPVRVTGKNLFNPNSEWNLRGSLTSGDYKFPGSLDGNRRTFFYKVKPNTTYTISVGTSGDRLGIIEFSRNINPINASTNQKITPDRVILTTSVEPENVYPYTFTTSSTAKIVGVYYSLNTMPINMQIEFGNTDTEYEEYQELNLVNVYIDAKINENESITFSDTTINIPTLNGTNVLAVDTTVQPSKVYVKSRKESQYETAMRERYEEAQAQLDALENGGE